MESFITIYTVFSCNCRALNESDTYVVLINFGAREETIHIEPLTKGFVEHLPEELEISAAGAESCYWKG